MFCFEDNNDIDQNTVSPTTWVGESVEGVGRLRNKDMD